MGRGMIATAAGLLIAEHAWVLLALLLVLAALTLLLHAGPGHAAARVIGERRQPSAEAWFAREMVAKGRRDLMAMEYVQDLELEYDYRLGLKQRPLPPAPGHNHPAGTVCGESCPLLREVMRGGGLPQRTAADALPMYAVCASCGRTFGEHSPFGPWNGACGEFRVQTPACVDVAVRELGAYPPLPTDGSSE